MVGRCFCLGWEADRASHQVQVYPSCPKATQKQTWFFAEEASDDIEAMQEPSSMAIFFRSVSCISAFLSGCDVKLTTFSTVFTLMA